MENKRVMLAVVLSLAVLLGWNFLFPTPKNVQQPTQATTTEAPAEAKPGPVAAPIGTLSAFAPTPGRMVTVKTPLYTAVFNSLGGVLDSFALSEYRQTIAADSPLVNLVSDLSRQKAPLGLLINGQPTWQAAKWSLEGGDLNLAAGQSGALTFVGQLGDLRIERTLTFTASNYLFDEKLALINASDAPVSLKVATALAVEKLSEKSESYNVTKVAYYNDSGLHTVTDIKDLEQGVLAETGVKWASVESNYFIMAAVALETGYLAKAKFEDGVYRVAMEKDAVAVTAGSRLELPSAYYLGAKETAYLAKAPGNLAASVDYGWFDFIAKPLLILLDFLHGYVGNYGVAIILLTIIIKIVFWPLTHKSYKSMDQLRKLQPLMAQIREKHKDDRQKMNEEMMRLYKTYKVNPAGGCLPMVVQIPVFIGLYQALLNAIELRHAPFIAHVPFTDIVWLADLSVKDPFYVTPIVMGATMFLQQKMTPAPGDPTQAKIMLALPIVFTFMFLNFPSGLVVYWLVNNVLSIAQQWRLMSKSSKA
ncbi:MAG: membrane protein insertase YidC [Desulfovibrionaceae bacterium]|nr:membrane protein insertase YidC [Desulfovibrionaceae bacterium]